MSKVSIIIPIYNAEKYLVKTIQSVISQTYSDLELILVNDGSTDSSSKICMEFACRDNRIVFKNQENKGVSAARNNGLLSATGDWVYFLDSDDTIDCKFLEDISSFFKESTDVIQFGSRTKENSLVLSYRQSIKSGELKSVNSFSDFIQTSNIGALCVWLHIIRKDVICNNRIVFSEDMQHNEDMLFMYEVLINSNNYTFVGLTLHTQFLVPNSLSRCPMNELKIDNRLLLIDRVLDLAEKKPNVKDDLENEVNKLLKGYFGSLLSLYSNGETDLRAFNKKYNSLYYKRKDQFKGLLPKIGTISSLSIIFLLRIKVWIKLKLS